MNDKNNKENKQKNFSKLGWLIGLLLGIVLLLVLILGLMTINRVSVKDGRYTEQVSQLNADTESEEQLAQPCGEDQVEKERGKWEAVKGESGEAENSAKKEYSKEVARFGDLKAYLKNENKRNYLILEKDGKQIVIDEGEAEYHEEYTNIMEVKSFSEVRFSGKGNYLIYTMTGWEWMFQYAYDVAREKIVFEADSPAAFEFTPDEDYLYVCTSEGMTTNLGGHVYSVPDFKEVYQLNLESVVKEAQPLLPDFVSCDFDNEKNAVRFEVAVACPYEKMEAGICSSDDKKVIERYFPLD